MCVCVAQRSSVRVFELAAGGEPAWLVARREPVRYALGMLYSIDGKSNDWEHLERFVFFLLVNLA